MQQGDDKLLHTEPYSDYVSPVDYSMDMSEAGDVNKTADTLTADEGSLEDEELAARSEAVFRGDDHIVTETEVSADDNVAGELEVRPLKTWEM